MRQRAIILIQIVSSWSNFDSRCAREYVSIRSYLEKEGKKIGPNNLMIASIARAHNAVLVTHNMREFKRVPGIELEDWAEVVF